MFEQKSQFVTDWLDKRAKLSGERVALYDTITGREVTYREWNATANQTAHLLRDLGVEVGDRVAIYATNCLEYFDVWMACGKIGAVLQNLNWRLTAYEISQLIADAQPRVLIYSNEFAAQTLEIRQQAATIEYYMAIGETRNESDLGLEQRDNFPIMFTDRPDLDPDAPWLICYTGGISGLPKGAILTHANMTWNSVNTVISWGLDQNDVSILNTPMFHTVGLNVLTLPLVHVGGKTIICKEFDATQVYDLISEAGVTVLVVFPHNCVDLQNHPRWDKANLSGLKFVLSGGAPVPMPVLEKFLAKEVPFRVIYGLTEAGPNTFWLPDEDIHRKAGSVGFPLFHVDVRIVKRDGTECEPGVPGELLIRGPHVTPGYWNNPNATTYAIEDGWLRTGDVALRDQQGYYFLVGLMKDMIMSGGENIYPIEVEITLRNHPAVIEAALISVPDARRGEVGRAIVSVRPGRVVEEAEIMGFLQQRLAKYKIPESIVFVDEIPKTGWGKVDKKYLAHRYGMI